MPATAFTVEVALKEIRLEYLDITEQGEWTGMQHAQHVMATMEGMLAQSANAPGLPKLEQKPP